MESHYHNFNFTKKKDRVPDWVKAVFLPLLLAIAIIALPVKRAGAQSAPTLSYNSPQVYLPNASITPLTPTSSGVATLAYSTTAVTINTGLSSPYGVATDAAGNLYVSDLATKIVKEFPAGGGTPVIIGSGEFSNPKGITVDAGGNVYAAGDYNAMVTEILKSNGSAVNLGTGFNEFSDVAVDGAGNVYVADFGSNNSVKEILKSNGSTVGIGTGFSNYCIAVATDAAGNVYVADTQTGIKEILASNGNTISLGSGFINPQGVAVDAVGNVYVSDQGNGAIKEIPVGSSTPITLVSGLTNPGQIAVDGAGDVYFVDTTTGTVQEIKPVGGYYISALPPGLSFNNNTGVISGITTTNIPPTNYTVTAYNANGSAMAVVNITIGAPPAPTLSYQSPQTYTSGAAIFPLTPSSTGVSPPAYSGNKITVGTGYNDDQAVATDAAGDIYVTDQYNNAVKKIPAGGGVQTTVASGLTGGVYGVAVDAAGNLYVSESNINAVLKIPAGGGSPVSIGSGFNSPRGLAVDAAGNVYVADVQNNAIKEILASNGSTITLATGLGNGYGVAVDAAGNVYVAATYNNKIVKIPAGGGTPVSIGSGFSTPESVAVDVAGNVYVSDFDSKSIKMIAVGGGTTTIATNFSYPQGLAIDGAGNIYLADPNFDVVFQIKPAGGYYLNTALPAGLSFNGTTGVIRGAPSAVSAAKNYTVTAYNTAGSAKATVNIGVVAPVTITSITRQNAALTNTFYAPYTVVFSGPVTGLTPSDFSVTTTGGITGASINYISGSGNTFTVVVFTGAGDGTITLNMANDLGVLPGVSTALPFAGNSYTIDKTPPQATTLYMNSNNPNPAVAVVGNIITLYFGVNEAVQSTSVTIAGHNVTPVLNGNIYSATYTMTASDLPGRVHFTLSFVDLAGNSSANYTDESAGDDIEFTLSSAVSSINVQNPSNTITNAKTVTWRVTFSLNVTGVNTSNFSLTNGGSTAAGTISGVNQVSGSVYDVTANNVSGDGNLTLNLSNGTSISPSLTSTLPFVGQAYTIDNTLPDDFIGNPSVNNTTTGPVSYIIYYGDANLNAITLSAADITLNSTGTANGSVTVSTTGGVYTVTISNITGNGTLGFTLAAGTASDKAGNLAPQQVSPNFNVVAADATLTNFTIGGGTTYTPIFNKAVTVYYASVPNATTSTTITPYVSDSHATVTISGNPATSGQPYAVSNLGVGDNGFAIKVTAQGGTTSTTYVLYITRKPSSVATLSSLTVDNSVILSPTFNSNQLNYTASVPYTTTQVNITPVVTDATATINVGANVIASGTAIPFSLNTGVNTFTAIVTAQDGVTVSTYNITITRASKAPQTITFSTLPVKTYGDADFAPGAVSDNSTIPITYASDNTAVATIVNGQIHIVAAGEANITASQAGSDLFLAAEDVKVALTVNKAAITVAAYAQTKIYGQADPALTYKITVGALVGSDAFTGALTRTPGESMGTYAITQGTLSLNNNYTLGYVGANLIINQATLTITANNQTKVYGAANPGLTVSYSGFTNGDSISGFTTQPIISTTGTTGSPVATYPITVSGAVIPNYNVVYVKGNLTITKAILMVTADNKSRNYGVVNPAFTVTYSGFVNSDGIANLTTPAKATTKATTTSGPGSYAITPGGGVAANYSFKYLNGILTIIPLTNADINDLSLSSGTLSPGFSTSTYAYNASVENAVRQVELTVTFDPTATATVNGTSTPNGDLSSPVDLNVGNNTITITVTAQDGITTQTYVVTVYRGEPIADISATNILTPNGDGKNDTWVVKDIALYPNNNVTVYDRGGRVVYTKHGYKNEWAGTVNGQPLQEGTYFYVVDLGVREFRGFISILKSR